MNDPRPLASLTSGLLARKGGARPAMRRQSINLSGVASSHLEDLGWNDMGYDVDPDAGTHARPSINFKPLANAVPEVIRQQDRLAEELEDVGEEIAEHAASEESAREEPVNKPRKTMALPPVLDEPVEVQAVSENADAEPPVVAAAPRQMVSEKPEQIVEDVAVKKPVKAGKRAAFTLRVDPERHLRLRLACAVRGQSAQTLVTEALDQFLSSMPEVDELARHVPNTAAETD